MTRSQQSILVTGGAGFIGSNFILHWLAQEGPPVVNLDKLTYAGNPANLAELSDDDRYVFARGDINDAELVSDLLQRHKPVAVIHFAAESHVDRSIHNAQEFIRTNIEGTFQLLQAARQYWTGLAETEKQVFRFLHVSTDEVYGSLGRDDPAFSESTAYSPNSPYSASKAASDHLVRAYFHTYGLPVLTTNCSNNYGPFQFPEKLIPLVILHAISGKPIPVYGDGQNVRDWLFVTDHCEAIRNALARGKPGETYNIGGENELKNLDVVNTICSTLDELRPNDAVVPHAKLITFVTDRPGHDRRYAMNAAKIKSELGWKPRDTFETGIRKTILWYLENEAWIKAVTSGTYRQWMATQYSL